MGPARAGPLSKLAAERSGRTGDWAVLRALEQTRRTPPGEAQPGQPGRRARTGGLQPTVAQMPDSPSLMRPSKMAPFSAVECAIELSVTPFGTNLEPRPESLGNIVGRYPVHCLDEVDPRGEFGRSSWTARALGSRIEAWQHSGTDPWQRRPGGQPAMESAQDVIFGRLLELHPSIVLSAAPTADAARLPAADGRKGRCP